MLTPLQERRFFAGYRDEEMPLGSYALLMGVYGASLAGFLGWRHGRALPVRLTLRDALLLGVATHKLSRILARDFVTSPLRAPFVRYEGKRPAAEVSESAELVTREVSDAPVLRVSALWLRGGGTVGFGGTVENRGSGSGNFDTLTLGLPTGWSVQGSVTQPSGAPIAIQDMTAYVSSVEFGDGIVLRGLTLYVVQNNLNAIAKVEEFKMEELSDVGCELKDFRTGLVDFVGRHQGRDVCLCWKLGEDRIAFWHETSAGYAGRQPVSSLEEE